MGDNILVNVKSALRRSGYTDSQIAEIITADKPAPVKQMKAIAETLSQKKVFGFEKNQERAIKKYLDRERVKAQSIAGIRKEHVLEAAEENLAKAGATSLNQKAIGPNSAAAGQASVLARRRGSAASYSLSGKSNDKKIESFNARSGSASIPRPGIGQTGSAGGISLKPKF